MSLLSAGTVERKSPWPQKHESYVAKAPPNQKFSFSEELLVVGQSGGGDGMVAAVLIALSDLKFQIMSGDRVQRLTLLIEMLHSSPKGVSALLVSLGNNIGDSPISCVSPLCYGGLPSSDWIKAQ